MRGEQRKKKEYKGEHEEQGEQNDYENLNKVAVEDNTETYMKGRSICSFTRGHGIVISSNFKIRDH